LPADVGARLEKLAGRRLTKDGVVVITAQRFRTQEANRRDALNRLVGLIAAAAEVLPMRRQTRPTLASRRRRIEAKKLRGAIKRTRQDSGTED
jgi:ribosome-associated protein